MGRRVTLFASWHGSDLVQLVGDLLDGLAVRRGGVLAEEAPAVRLGVLPVQDVVRVRLDLASDPRHHARKAVDDILK